MPLPMPSKGESQDDFMGRCMGNKTMMSDFPGQPQRLAVCFKQWRAKRDDDDPEIEERAAVGLELRQGANHSKRLVGYAAVFGSRSLDLGGFVEIIRKGAFSRSLGEGVDIRAFVNHDPGRIIGRRSAGTLQIEEDMLGLRVEITPPDTQDGRDILENVRVGNLDGMSFGFRVPRDGDIWDLEQQPPVRELVSVELREVSIVSMPAYPKTEVALRSLAAARQQPYRPSMAMNRARQRQAEE
jgi:uncharacterized protein